MAPSDCPHLVLQAMAGPLAAATASTVTNPMDVIRARVQVISIAPDMYSLACVTECVYMYNKTQTTIKNQFI